jgi:hypothetical protein
MISPIRIYLIAAAIAVLASGALWYRHALIGQGKAECKASVQRAIEQQRAIAEQNAVLYETGEQKARIEYRTRIKEVAKYVPINHGCDLAPDALRVLNDAISASRTVAR